jgi:hypothetical protein
MKRAILAFGLGLAAPGAAEAAPIVLNFNVVFDHVTDLASGTVSSDPLQCLMTVTYDDGVTFENLVKGDDVYAYRQFGTPTVTFSGTDLIALSNTYDAADRFARTQVDVSNEWGVGVVARARVLEEFSQTTDLGGQQVRWEQKMVVTGTRSLADPAEVDPDAAFLLAALQGGVPLYVFYSEYTAVTTDHFLTGPNIQPGSFDARGMATYIPPAAVPEPSSIVLLGTSLVSLVARMRHRRRLEQ